MPPQAPKPGKQRLKSPPSIVVPLDQLDAATQEVTAPLSELGARQEPSRPKSLSERISDFAGTYSAKDEELDRALSLGGLLPPPFQVAKGAVSGVLGLGRMVSGLAPKSPLEIALPGLSAVRSMIVEPVAAEHERYVAARDRPEIQGGRDVSGMVRAGIGQLPIVGPISSGLAETVDPGIASLEQGQRPAPVKAGTELLTMLVGPKLALRGAGAALRVPAELVRRPLARYWDVAEDPRPAIARTLETTERAGETIRTASRGVADEIGARFGFIDQSIPQPLATGEQLASAFEQTASRYGVAPERLSLKPFGENRWGIEIPRPEGMSDVASFQVGEGGALNFAQLRKFNQELYRLSQRPSLPRDVRASIIDLYKQIRDDVLQPAADAVGQGRDFAAARAAWEQYAKTLGPGSKVGELLERIDSPEDFVRYARGVNESDIRAAVNQFSQSNPEFAQALNDLYQVIHTKAGEPYIPGTGIFAPLEMSDIQARLGRLESLSRGQYALGDPGQFGYTAGRIRLGAELPLRSQTVRRWLVRGAGEEPPISRTPFQMPPFPPSPVTNLPPLLPGFRGGDIIPPTGESIPAYGIGQRPPLALPPGPITLAEETGVMEQPRPVRPQTVETLPLPRTPPSLRSAGRANIAGAKPISAANRLLQLEGEAGRQAEVLRRNRPSMSPKQIAAAEEQLAQYREMRDEAAGAAPRMQLRNELARDQFRKGYLKLTPQERQLIDQLAAQVELGQP